MKNIKIYTTQTCPYCNAAKEMLTEKGLTYEAIDLTEKPELWQELSEKHDWRTVPMIFIDDELVGGFTDLQKLDAEGKLA
jgi:glutaredoxin 3